MAFNQPLRHELKFFINQAQYHLLSRALDRVLDRDPNGDENNEYHIRSLYFDTIYNTALYDKINGDQNRDKYRIRIYNLTDRVIKLECKTKVGSLISKRSLSIPRGLCEQLMAADPTGLESTRSGLLSDVYREMTVNLLHPVVLVDYVREAYLHPAEEVRITFDKQLRRTVKQRRLRSKTVTRAGAEMTYEVRLDNKQDLVASMLNIEGVHDATLVACQTEAGA